MQTAKNLLMHVVCRTMQLLRDILFFCTLSGWFCGTFVNNCAFLYAL